MKKLISIILCMFVLALCGLAAGESAQADRTVTITSEAPVVSIGKPLKLTTEIAKLSDSAPAKTVLEWVSGDESIAKVSAQGAVTGIAPGTVTITCRAKDNPEINASVTVTVVQPVKTVKPENAKMLLLLGSSEEAASGSIKVNILPENATVQQCSYVSSDESVVTVDENGNLHAVAAGKAKITIVPLEEGTKAKAVCDVTVGQAVTSITIPGSQTIATKKSFTLKPEVVPATAYQKTVEYSSSNEQVATVNKGGVVSAKSTGTATITCKATDGSGVIAECKITVIQPVTKVSSRTKKLVMFQGQSKKWYASAEPSEATNKKLSYSSDNTFYASVGNDGTITGNRGGKTKIHATSTDGSDKSCTVEVTVEPSVPISLDTIGFGIFNYNLLGITVSNKCQTLTIVNFNFDIDLYNFSGSKVNSGSFSLGKDERIGPRRQKTIRRTMYGVGQAYKVVMTITGVKFSDGSYWTIPAAQQETWSFTRR